MIRKQFFRKNGLSKTTKNRSIVVLVCLCVLTSCEKEVITPQKKIQEKVQLSDLNNFRIDIEDSPTIKRLKNIVPYLAGKILRDAFMIKYGLPEVINVQNMTDKELRLFKKNMRAFWLSEAQRKLKITHPDIYITLDRNNSYIVYAYFPIPGQKSILLAKIDLSKSRKLDEYL